MENTQFESRLRYYSYALYNMDTELVEATEYKLPDDVRQLNNILRNNGEPQRWVATLWLPQLIAIWAPRARSWTVVNH